jgi:hypothetical protein
VQQTPSTQIPELHSDAVLQEVPGSLFVTQTPPAQYSLRLQSPSNTQLAAVPPHRSPTQVAPVGHASVVGGGQLPAPSQNAERSATPFWQSAARHEMPGPGKAHERVVVPSQVPPHGVPAPAHAGRP